MTDLRTNDPFKDSGHLIIPDRIGVLIEEYRAMYALVLYRHAAFDQRTPIVTTVITGAMASIAALPPHLQVAFLMGLPVCLLWFVRSTMNHACSLEDAYRRIEEIETMANDTFRERLLVFQSTHPSRGKEVGGRTGREAVETVIVAAMMLLASAAFIAWHIEDLPAWAFNAYVAYLTLITGVTLANYRSLRQYRYRKRAMRVGLPG